MRDLSGHRGSVAEYRREDDSIFMEKPKRGFMCTVDFHHELGSAFGGTKIYPDEENLIMNRPCVDQCGIVEVEISIVRVVKESDYSDLTVQE